MTESTIFSTQYFLRQRFLMGLVALLNVCALAVLIVGLHRLLAKDSTDLSGTISLVGTLLGLYPIWRLAKFLVVGTSTGAHLAAKDLRLLVLIGHLAFWGFVPLLWLLILPWYSHYTHEDGIQAKEQQQYMKAINQLQHSLYLQTENARAHYDLAEIYEELANIDEAINHYRLGIHTDSGYPADAFNNLSRLLLIRGNNSGALDLLDLAEQRSDQAPVDDWIKTGVIDKNRAWAYYKLGLYIEAETFIVSARGHLSSAQKLSEYPEVNCLHALIAKHIYDDDLAKSAADLCIKSYQNQHYQKSKPFQGAARELYLQVLSLKF